MQSYHQLEVLNELARRIVIYRGDDRYPESDKALISGLKEMNIEEIPRKVFCILR